MNSSIPPPSSNNQFTSKHGWKDDSYGSMIGNCLLTATTIQPKEYKPFLRLADWAFSCWVRHKKDDGTSSSSSEETTLNLHELAFTNYCKMLTISSMAEMHFTSVTLRLMKLIVYRDPKSDSDKLENHLKDTPASCWTVIIPQLFSLTGHKDEFARRTATELLTRMSQLEKNSTAKIAFDVARGFSSLPSETSETAQKKQTSLLTIQKGLVKTGRLYDDVVKFQHLMDKLSALWGDQWFFLVDRVNSKKASEQRAKRAR